MSATGQKRSAARPARQHHALETISRRRWVRLAIAYLLLGASAWWYEPNADFAGWWVHGLWCFIGLALALPMLWRAMRGGFGVVLTDHRLVFLAAFSLYFLVGAALLAVGPTRQAELSLGLYPIGPSNALRVDAVNGLGFGLALLTSAVARGRWLGLQASRVAAQVGRQPATLVVVSFLLVGAAATFYRLSFDLGFQSGVVSGSVRTLDRLTLVAVFLAASSRGSHERMLRSVGVVLAVLLAVAGTLQFMKSEALLPLVALTAGLALRFGSRRILPLGLSLLVIGYMMLGSVVNYGRGAVFGRPATLVERWSYLIDGWTVTRDLAEDQEYAYWGRLCYVPTQAASLDFQDEGRGGEGLQLMWWVLVPRFLAPNKPQMTAMFGELNEKITGSAASANAPGIFASGYYHAGWWGLVLASALCGWILAQTSAIARAIYLAQASLLLPLSLYGMFIAFRIDGDFIPDYLGSFMFILYPLLAAALFLSVAGSGQRRRPLVS